MERQANYILVGGIFVAFLFGAFVFVVWLANFQFNQQYDNYRIVFSGAVSGISKGGEVQFNGIKMGEITNITLDKDDPNLVLTDIQLEAGTPVRTDSVATAASQGITGVKRIQITAGTPTMPLLREVSNDRLPVIKSEIGGLGDLVKSIEQVADGGVEAIDRVNRLLSDNNIDSISRTLSDVQAVADELNARRDMFGRMDSAIGKIDNAAGNLEAVIATARSTLGDNDTGALAEFAKASTEMNATVADLHRVIDQMEGPVSEISQETVPEMTAAVASIRQTADRIDDLLLMLEEEPSSLFTKRAGQEVEIPQ